MSEGSSSTRLPLTSSCDPPFLLCIYFQVKIGVSYLLDYVEDIYDDGGADTPSPEEKSKSLGDDDAECIVLRVPHTQYGFLSRVA